jgi:L-threonylcarbamoyladenylate synthase
MIELALAALDRGEIVGVPTDTVYGIAADPSRRDAVESLFSVKGRSETKPIAILCADIEQARSVALIDDRVGRTARSHWPGGLTLVVRRVPGSPVWLGDPVTDTVAVRVPDHPVALDLLRRYGPLAVTSANRSGDDPATDAIEARRLLGGAVAVYLEGRGSGGPPSTVVDVTVDPPRVIRPGAVEWSPV